MLQLKVFENNSTFIFVYVVFIHIIQLSPKCQVLKAVQQRCCSARTCIPRFLHGVRTAVFFSSFSLTSLDSLNGLPRKEGTARNLV